MPWTHRLEAELQKSLKSMPQTDKHFLARMLAESGRVQGKMDRNGFINSFNLWCGMSSRKARLGEGLG